LPINYTVNLSKMAAGECQTRNVNDDAEDDKDAPPPLDSEDISLLKSYGIGPYTHLLKKAEASIVTHQKTIT